MRVCYFGIYNPKHTRNRNLIDGLRANGVNILECNTRETSFKKYWQLIKLHNAIKKKYDVMVVGFPGHPVMPLAWLLARLNRKKVIFDAFISLYDSLVLDQKKYSSKNLLAKKYWLMDWLSCQLADIVLMEAQAYIDYLVKAFKIKPEKCKRIFVGSDTSVLYPRPQPRVGNDFLVHFHGSYLPIQGIPYIIKAAKILENENIKFNIIGKLGNYGQAINLAQELNLKNVNFINFVPYEKLADYMAKSDVCLGMFGDTPKAKRCGAFKIVEAMAMKKPIITADTPAIRELLTDRENCLLCKIADEKDLAAKILELKNKAELREKLANNAYQLFKEKLTPKVLGAELKDIVSRMEPE
jgi:glycosyltransferase involved in cell wall biosynthesis